MKILNILKNSCIILSIIILSATMFSCEEDEEIKQPDRMFSPALFNINVGVGTNEATVSWIPIFEATYSLEISKDNFATTLQSISFERGTQRYVLTNLESGNYSARIKAISSNPSVADSKYAVSTFVVP